VEQHSLNGFTENILPMLEKSEYYLFIDFRREELGSQRFRGSLFSHQELGIATYLKKEHILIFQERGVLERDGIKGYVQANPITFEDRRTLPSRILEEITCEGWKTGWRNELLMERTDYDYVNTFYMQTNSNVRFFHIRVTNNNNLKIAHECLVYLTKITNLNNGSEQRPPLVEFKWQPMRTKSVSISPHQSRNFDAFFVEIRTPNVVHLGINPFLLDFTGYYFPYILNRPGEYELEYVLTSQEFQTLRRIFSLHIGTNLEDLRLVAH
jgi:hypothetical protein